MNNKPNRVYISSDDAISDIDHSGNFMIHLEEPILNPKTVNVISCEYPSSFYNITTTDTFYFDEVYRNTSGTEVKRIRFSLNGITEDNYTASELATELSNQLTYSTNSRALYGVDTNFQLTVPNDLILKGHITTDSSTRLDSTDRQMFVKKIMNDGDGTGLRLSKITVEAQQQVGGIYTNHTSGLKDNYLFVMTETTSTSSVPHIELLVNLKGHFNNTTKFYEVDLLQYGIDLRLGTKAYYIGVILDTMVQLKGKNTPTSTHSYVTEDVAMIDPIISEIVNNNIDVAKVSFQPPSFSHSTHDNTNEEPNMMAYLSHIYDHRYNHSSSLNYLKAELSVTHDDNIKRFSIKPQKHTQYRDNNGNAVTGDTFPFYKNPYLFGRTFLTNGGMYSGVMANTAVWNYDSNLEIPNMMSDPTSINYKIGARNRTNLYSVGYTSLPVTANNIIKMEHIPRLIRYPFLYLTCDFINDSVKTGGNKHNILQKLPLSSEYGNVNFFNVSSAESMLNCKVSRQYLQTMRFQLVDKDNKEVDLSGGELSLVLNFEY